ncbi:MAG: aldose 1-epimerase family protein [Nocardioides sp.]
MVAPSGEQHVIEAAGYRAVATECGAGLRTLEYDGRPLVAGFPEDQQASAGRGQLLLPWPNRIADGRYAFEGRDLQLPLSEVARGHASHGLTRWASWRLLDQAEDAVLLGYRLMSQPGYPWSLELTARYALSAEGLTVTVTAQNLADRLAPFASGAHPYLTAGEPGLESWRLTVAAESALTVDDRLIPTGRVPVAGSALDFNDASRIGDTDLDTAYTGLVRDEDGTASVHLVGADGGVTLWMDEHHRWVQLFTGPAGTREALAVEPMTAPPNAFSSGEDLIRLAPYGAPGDSVTITWGIRAQAGG